MGETSAYSAGLSTGSLIAYLIILVIAIVAMWKIFEKAGIPGWAAIIPFYNAYCLFKMTWGNGWMFLLSFIPIVSVVVSIITMVKLSKTFGKGTGFTIGLIFLSFIFMCILAFGSSEYTGIQE